MEPGRELDALVAEKVMGLRVEWGQDTPCPDCDEVGRYCGGRAWCSPCRAWYYSAYKDYSTDIAAAWEVVERLVAGGERHFVVEKAGAWLVRFREGDWLPGETAPHAICLAALRAVGYEANPMCAKEVQNEA